MYTCTTKQGITAHCKGQHGWVNNQKQGGDARKKQKQATNRLWSENQPCQRVFRSSGWPAYVALEATSCPRDADDLLETVKAERKRIEDEEATAAKQDTIREGRRQVPNPWLELTGWVPHLKGIMREELLCARLPPEDQAAGSRQDVHNEDEAALVKACHAMQRLVQKAFRASRPEVVGRPALELIERRETGAESNEKPFYSHQKLNTIRRYSGKLTSIICYLWRTCDNSKLPRYRLSHNQEAHMNDMKALARQQHPRSRKALERACLRFWIALLDHSLVDDEYKSALLSGVAVLGLKPVHLGGGWHPAHDFAPVLSAIITTSKALVLYSAYREQIASEAHSDANPSVHELVRDMAERFMTLSSYRGIVSPMNRMLRLRTLARAMAKQRNTSGFVSWDGDKILVDRQSFTVLDLQSMIKGLCETLRLQLLTDVLLLDVDESGRVQSGTAGLPDLAIDQLTDQPAELAASFSFLQHPDNGFDAWRDWLLNRVIREPALRRRFRAGMRGEVWRDSAVLAYMKGVRKFKEGLFALVHLSAGAPARGTEITSILCENDADGVGHRGVFVHRGLVSFVTTYHKGYSFSKRVKTIHRFVPREVGELVVYFLGLARPFIVDMQKMHYGVKESTPFIWEPAPEEQAEADSSGESDAEDGNDDPWGYESDRGGDSEAAGERTTAAPVEKPRSANPDGYWGTDRIRRVLRAYTAEYMDAAIGTRTWRHSYPAIHREITSDSKSREMLDMVYYNQDPVTSDARALQSGHTVQTEESNYGRLMIESPNETYREREQFRRVSVDWHQLLGFASAWEGSHTHPGQMEHMRAQHEQRASLRWAALASANLKAEFRALLKNPAAEFRSKQEQGLQAVCERRLRVLVVMATGAGKSMLFMLPAALAHSGITVVIAPLNALRDDMLDRCKKMGIKCAKWDGRRPPYWASIVLVTPEVAVSPSFGRFIDEKRMMQELDRIVIDECHVLMESSPKWRPEVLKLTQMTEKDTQVVYLTATLPPTLQSNFLQLAGLNEWSLTICRDDRTTRPNIAYHVVDYNRDQLEDTLAMLIAQKREQYGPDAQIIVYCPTLALTKSLARSLHCTAYYSDMGTEEEKACRVRAFANGVEKTCTATNMLGLGLDAPGVRVVIHVAMSFLLRQYVQESGRAGRAGLLSESIVLMPTWRTKAGETRRSFSTKLDEPAKAFLTSTACRRIAIDSHMDGRQDRRQCEVGEVPCDLCSPCSRGTKRPVETAALCNNDISSAVIRENTKRQKLVTEVTLEQRRIDIQRRQDAERRAFELERLDRHLQSWRGVCAICMAVRGVQGRHAWESCPDSLSEVRSMEYWLKVVHSVQWDPFARCPGCSVPQAICDRWEATDEQGAFHDRNDDSCQYKNVLPRAVAALAACQGDLFKTWTVPVLEKARLPTTPFKAVHVAAVLGKKVKLGQQDASHMASFFLAWGEGVIQYQF